MKNLQPRKAFRAPATLATVALAAGSGSALSAVLSFSEPYQLDPPANGIYTETLSGSENFGAWTGEFSNTIGIASRTVTTTNAPSILVLAIADSSQSQAVKSFKFFATVPVSAVAGNVSFNYDYTESSDYFSLGDFSYLKNGVATQIAAVPGSNSITFAVSPGDTFGFQLSGGYSMNNSATITSFAAPVPEPSALVLLATGFTGIIGMRRRRQQAAA